MKQCKCSRHREVNLSDAQITIRSPHDITIHIDREAQNPTLVSLRKRIEQLELFNLHLDDEIDRLLGDKIQSLDLVTRAALSELLSTYTTADELQAFTDNIMAVLAQEREYNDARYLQKAYITQEAYDAMSETDKKENTIYVIRN